MNNQQDSKKHFKLYKAGKLWLVTALASAGFIVTGHHHVKADTLNQANNAVIKNVDNANSSSQLQKMSNTGFDDSQPSGDSSTTQLSTTTFVVNKNDSTTNNAQNTQQNQKTEFTENGQWYLKDQNNNILNGFQHLNDDRTVYYQPNNNAMVHGEALIDNHWYHFDENTGAMSTGITTLPSGKTVYYANNGQIQYGFVTVGNDRYYFGKTNGDGRMVKGEALIDNHWYHFDENTGAMSTGITTLPSGKTVYYANNGQIQYGPETIGNNHYYFEYGQGNMVTGVFFNPELSDLQFYGNNGQRQAGTINLNGTSYNFDGQEDSLVTDTLGEKLISGKWYYFKTKTEVATGLIKLSDGRTVYYSPENGQMVHGELLLNGHWKYFDLNDGHEYINSFAQLSDGRTTYYDAQGNIVYGEQLINNSWYHFDENTGAMTKGFCALPNKTVYYDNAGKMVYGWRNIDGHQYYFGNGDGHMYRGRNWIDGKQYSFNNNGQLDEWGWPFPNVGEGHFMGSQLFGVNPGGEFRMNGFHDGLDFGSIDHPGSEVHAIHSGKVVGIGYAAGLDNYVLVDTGDYLIVYQEAFANRGDIWVHVGQEINTGDVIGRRDTSHVHIGVTRQHNFNVALANSFNNNGTWLNPLTLIRNGQ